LKDLQNKSQPTTTVHMDNQGAKTMAEQPSTKQHSKHIDIKYHYTREKIMDTTIALKYVHTSHNIADCLTKAVTKAVLEETSPALFGLHIDTKDSRLRGGVNMSSSSP
jgi:hypothetical protein